MSFGENCENLQKQPKILKYLEISDFGVFSDFSTIFRAKTTKNAFRTWLGQYCASSLAPAPQPSGNLRAPSGTFGQPSGNLRAPSGTFGHPGFFGGLRGVLLGFVVQGLFSQNLTKFEKFGGEPAQVCYTSVLGVNETISSEQLKLVPRLSSCRTDSKRLAISPFF